MKLEQPEWGFWAGIVGLSILFFVLVIVPEKQAPEKQAPERHKEIVLKDGTRCVVLKGFYTDSAITCDWSK